MQLLPAKSSLAEEQTPLPVYIATFAAVVIARAVLVSAGDLPALAAQLLGVATLATVLFRPGKQFPLLVLGLGLALGPGLLHLGLQVLSAQGQVAPALVAALDWPLPVLLAIGSRILAVSTAERFREAWDCREPGLLPPPHGLASSALAGLFLTILLALCLESLPPLSSSPVSRLLVTALRGSTGLHLAILVLGFTLLAAVIEAGFRLQADRHDLARLASGHPPRPGSRLAALLALARAASPAAGERAAIRLDFEAAARRQLRALLPLLPLLGFLGTVVGLATAIADLPAALARPGGADISAALAGLAVKFETTLLGLAASMGLAIMLARLERREAELALSIRRFAADTGRAGPPP